MPSHLDVFQFGTFLSVALRESRCIFAFVPSSSPSHSFHILLIHSAFVMFFSFLFVALKLFPFLVLLLFVCVCTFSPLLAGRIFFGVFGMSCFVCIALSCLDIFLVFLLSPVPSNLFLRVYCLFYLCYFSSFRLTMFPCSPSVLSFSLVVDFLSAFPLEFHIHVLSFCSYSLWELWLFSWLVSLPHRLVRLISWCCPLIIIINIIYFLLVFGVVDYNVWVRLFDFLSVHEKTNECGY